MIPGKSYDVEDILAILHRRGWLVVWTFLFVAALGAFAAWVLPSRWESTAVISIVPQRVPESYVRSTVTIGPQDRLDAIKRDLMSRPRLEQVIREFKLYAELGQTPEISDVMVDRARRDIRMALTKDEAFEVSFSSREPVLAQRVASRLAALFIGENIRQRAQLAAGSSEFLKSQLATAREQLERTERRLEDFRRTYSGQLPDQMPGNMQAITNTQMQLQQIRESINRDRDRRLILERQIADMADPLFDPPDVMPARSDVSMLSTAEQLRLASGSLADLQRRLTGDHPDVRQAKRRVADLEAQLATEQASGSSPEARLPTLSPAEIARRARTRLLREEIAGIDSSVAGKQIEERRLQGVSADYQRKIDAAPMRQSELTALMRDYETVSQQYKELLTNAKAAEMSEDLERRQGGEQFRLVEEARVPEKPSSPKRPLIVAGSLIAGIALALAFAGALEVRDSSLRRREDVLTALALPVLAVVPVLTTESERRRTANRFRLASVATAVLTVIAVAAAWGALTR